MLHTCDTQTLYRAWDRLVREARNKRASHRGSAEDVLVCALAMAAELRKRGATMHGPPTTLYW